jgi:hypothetical protein
MMIAPGTSPSTIRCSSGQAAARLGQQLADAGRVRGQRVVAELGRRRGRVGQRGVRAAASTGAFRAVDGHGLGGDQAVVGGLVIGHRHQRRRVGVNARGRAVAAVRHVVDVPGPERHRLAREQVPLALPVAPAGRPVALGQAALGHGERA